MLPVQTVMIRYMVLVYRWGRGWLDGAALWGGDLGGDVTGVCARGGGGTRGGALAAGVRGRAKAPPTRGRRGLLPVNLIQWAFLLRCH